MGKRQPVGLIPAGHIPLLKFIADIVCHIYGPQAVAEITKTRTSGGTFFELGDGDGKQRLQNADLWITRSGGEETPERDDNARWNAARDTIREAFQRDQLRAIVGAGYIPPDYWKDDLSDLALCSGTYDMAPDKAHEGKPIFVLEEAATQFVRSLRPPSSNNAEPPAMDAIRSHQQSTKAKLSPPKAHVQEWIETLTKNAPYNRAYFRSAYAKQFPNAPKSGADEVFKHLDATLKIKRGRPKQFAE